MLVLAVSGCTSPENSPVAAAADNALPTIGMELPVDVSFPMLKPGHCSYSNSYFLPVSTENNGTISVTGTLKASGREDGSERTVLVELYMVNNDDHARYSQAVTFTGQKDVSFEFTALGNRSDYYL